MNISFVEKNDNFARIELKLTKEDYQEAVEKGLKKIRRNASIPGFRKGAVPTGMVKKMYGDSVKIEEVQNLVSEKLYNFIVEEKLKTIGQTIATPGTEAIDIVKAEDMTFTFDQALIPEITDILGKGDHFTYYKATASEQMIEDSLQQSLENAGERVEADVVSAEDVVRGSIAELDGDLPKEGGIRRENGAFILPAYIKNEEERAKFVGAPRNSVVIFSPFKAYEGQESEIASLLGIEKNQVAALEGVDFSFEINTINHHQKAEMNQEFFDKVFGEGEVKSETEARAKIKEFLETRTEADSNFKLLSDVKEYIRANKIANINLHEDTIKAWWTSTDAVKEQSEEQINEIFPRLIEDLKVDLYMEALVEKYEVKVEAHEVEEFAKEMTRMQFRQYGMSNMPEDLIDQYTKNMLKDANTYTRIRESIKEQKVVVKLKDDVTLDEQTMTFEEFNSMLNPIPEAETEAAE